MDPLNKVLESKPVKGSEMPTLRAQLELLMRVNTNHLKMLKRQYKPIEVHSGDTVVIVHVENAYSNCNIGSVVSASKSSDDAIVRLWDGSRVQIGKEFLTVVNVACPITPSSVKLSERLTVSAMAFRSHILKDRTISELSKFTGLHPNRLSKIANGKANIASLKKDLLDALFAFDASGTEAFVKACLTESIQD